jgi:hypothetical protein
MAVAVHGYPDAEVPQAILNGLEVHTSLADIALLRSEPGLYGLVASDATVSRTISALAADAPAALVAIDTARTAGRARAWKLAGKHAPDHGGFALREGTGCPDL